MPSTFTHSVRIFLIATIVTIIGLSSVIAAEYPPTPTQHYLQDRAAPVIVLIERDPWQLVFGADSPSFALYDTGLLIYRTPDNFQSVLLNDDDYADLLVDLNVDDSFLDLHEYYDVSLATDQPMNTIHAWRNGERKTVSVYGDLNDGNFTELDDVPLAFLNLFETMTEYSHPDAQEWLPERIEVMMWPSDQTDGAVWPDDFPSLNSQYAARRNNDQFSIFLDASQQDRLTDIYQKSSTILINQFAWWFSWRIPFPNEMSWTNPTLEDIPSFADFQNDVSTFGSGVFGDEKWSLTLSDDYLENNFLSISASWLRDDGSATANYSRQLQRSPFSDVDALSDALSDRWMAVEWMAYQDVQIVLTCVVGETVLVDLLLVDNGSELVARYWVWQEGASLNEFALVFPASDTTELDTLADNLISDAPRCPVD